MRLDAVLISLLGGCVASTSCNGAQTVMQNNSPGTVIFRSADGRTLTAEDLSGATGTFSYELIGAGNVPAEAEALHRQGREAGARGDFNKALALLENAARLAPEWPYPVYDAAYTHLLLHDYATARTYYQKTVDLSPRGFFKAITAVDTLTRERSGEVPVGTYLEYLSLEWQEDPAKKAKAVRELVRRVPNFAPAWSELAGLADSDQNRLAIIEKGLAARPDAETKGELQIDKALVLNLLGHRDEAIRLLGELALDPNSTFATERLSKSALATLSKR